VRGWQGLLALHFARGACASQHLTAAGVASWTVDMMGASCLVFAGGWWVVGAGWGMQGDDTQAHSVRVRGRRERDDQPYRGRVCAAC